MDDNIQIFTETVRYDEDEQHVFIKPLCDMFGLDYDNQYQYILRDAVVKNQYITKADAQIFGDNRPRAALTKVGFVRWVQTLNPDSVDPLLRDKLIQYQLNIIEWIMGKVDVDMAVRKCYKRSNEIDDIIKKLKAEKKDCDAFVKGYLISKAYQTALAFDHKALN